MLRRRPTLIVFPYTTLFRSDVVDAAIDAARELKFPSASKIDKQNVLVEFGHFGHTTTGITAQMRKKGDGTLEVTVVNGSVRSEEHTLNSSHRCISYAVFCLK